MEKTPLPIDAVERVRAIRDRHYEETKHMTREEREAHDWQRINKSVAAFEERIAKANPDPSRFPFLAKKS